MTPRLLAALAPITVALLAGLPARSQAPEMAETVQSDGGAAGGIAFGNDSSEWAMDAECDDRRFVGEGMATSLSWANVGRDATDCRALQDAGRVRAWDWAEAQAATRCEAIDFGDDSGEYANDGECDDIRFEGLGAASSVSTISRGKDAGDCSRLCGFGVIALRDY